MTESFDAIVVGAGPTGSLAALAAAERGARVLLLERGPAAGATGPSAGVVRPGDGAAPPIDPALKERSSIEQRMLVLDEAASLSFDFRDQSLARVPAPAFSVLSSVVATAWAESARAKGAQVVTGADQLRLRANAQGAVTGVEVAGATYDAPITVLTEPTVEALGGSATALALEETYELAPRSVESRFQLRPGEGTAIEALLGFLPPTWTGRGWIVTHRERLTLGVTLHRPPGDEAATGLESAYERFLHHPAIEGYTTGARRVDRRQYPLGTAPTRTALAAPGVLRAGPAAGLGDPVGVFFPGVAAAWSSAQAAGASVAPGTGAVSPSRGRPEVAYRAELRRTGILDLIDRARARPIPMGWGGAQRQRYARVLATTFHELLSETGARKESVSRTLRRVRRSSRSSMTGLARDAFDLGRNL